MHSTIHSGTKQISHGHVISLLDVHALNSRSLSHQCFGISLPVEFEGEKDELEDVDGAEELELEGAVVPHAPYAHRHRHHADEDLKMKISIGRTGRSEEISEDVIFSGP